MSEIFSMFGTQLFLLCLMLVGVISAKIRLMDVNGRAVMSELVFNVFLPCAILNSFFSTGGSQFMSLIVILFISLGILAFCFGFGRLLFYRLGPQQKKVMLYSVLVSNAAFLGMPVTENIFGPASLAYVAVYLLPVRVAIWTAGVAIFNSEKTSIVKMLFNPCMVATYIGFCVMLLGFTPPVMVSRVVSSLAGCNTPIVMIVVGHVLGMIDPRRILSRLAVFYSFIRLILIPLLVMLVLLLLRIDPMVMGIAVILSGMPAGPMTVIFAEKYRADSELASKIIFMSTLLSMLTVPLLAWLLQFLST